MDATSQRRVLPVVLYVGATEGLGAVNEVLTGHAEVIEVAADEASVAAGLRSAVAIVDASTRIPIGAAALEQARSLRIISCASTGSAHVDHGAARGFGVEVRTLREDRALLEGLTPAAEHTWALVLACARSLPSAADHVRDGGWERERFPGRMLRGRRVGLVGCGRIGRWVARYAQAFDMRVAGYDPHLTEWPEGIQQRALAELVATSDIISVHVHLSEETRGLIGRELLESCRPGAIVVNTSRGGIVDEGALLDGLRSGRIGAAGLDVLATEPAAVDDPLIEYAREHTNLIITPHIGGFSPDAVSVVCRRAAEKVLQRLESGEP